MHEKISPIPSCTESTFTGSRLLLVSPNRAMGTRRHHLLIAAGYHPITVDSTAQALVLIDNGPYAAIIMGQMLGYTNRRVLMEAAQRLHIPVIAIHVLPWEDSCEADYCVRITRGAKGLLETILQAIQTASGTTETLQTTGAFPG